MKLTDKQIEWLINHVHVIEIDSSDFDTLVVGAESLEGKPDATVAWEASFEEDGLLYEEVITLGDLRGGVLEDDTLQLADGRTLRFKRTRVIAWEELDNEN